MIKLFYKSTEDGIKVWQHTEREENMDEMILNPIDVQNEIRRTRHKAEVPLYIIISILGIITSAVIVIMADDGGILQSLLQSIAESDVVRDVPDFGTFIALLLFFISVISGIGTIIVMLIAALVMMYKMYGEQMSYSVRVSEDNFPEIYEKVKEYTMLLGLKKEPEIYIQQSNGTLNALTSWIPGKAFIQINAEIADIAYMENKDLDTLYFVMAHEFGHIYLHHVQIHYVILPMLANFIPVLGKFFLVPLLSRSREYSADRVAQALTNGKSQLECMMLLSAGRHLYKYAKPEKYIEDIYAEKNAVERLARWIINMLASHPIMPFRTKAVLDPEKASGRLL